MISVTSKFTINRTALAQLDVAAAIALEQTAEALHTDVVQAQVIPRDTGNLQDEAFSVDKKDAPRGLVRLVHSAPYARRVYFNPDGLKFHRQAWESLLQNISKKQIRMRRRKINEFYGLLWNEKRSLSAEYPAGIPL